MPMNPRLLRPLASGFSPRQISGLALWLDASDEQTVTLATGVSQWRDKTSNARHANQNTGVSQPGYSLASLNGKNTLSFDGDNDWLQQSSYTISQPVTFFAVAQSLANSRQVFDGTGSNRQTIYRNASGNWEAWAGTSPLNGGAAGTAWAVLSCVFNGSSSAFRVNGGNAITGNAGTNSVTAGLTIGSFGNGTSSFLQGAIAELFFYNAALSATNRAKVEGYLAWKWGLEAQLPSNHPYAYSFPGFGSQARPSNADALAWESAVYSNSGSTSVGTLTAVNDFCSAIDAAGIRDRFYRLNLFAGTGLNAALVPLYRAASLGDTQLGNATDTNVGPFVSGDFADATGLAAGSGKYLRTGLTQTSVGLACHLASYDCVRPTNSYAAKLGSRGASNAHEHLITNVDVATTIDYGSGSVAGNGRARATGYTQTGAFWLGINPSSTSSILYKNGASAATGTPSARTAQSLEYYVFGLNNNGSLADSTTTGRSGGYSIGLSMDATQAAAYYTAMQAFQTSLTRNA